MSKRFPVQWIFQPRIDIRPGSEPPGIAHKCTRVFPLRSQPHLRPPQLSCMSSMFLIAPQVEISHTTHYYPSTVVFSYPIYRSQKIAHHPCTVAARDEPGATRRAASAVPSYIKYCACIFCLCLCAPRRLRLWCLG